MKTLRSIFCVLFGNWGIHVALLLLRVVAGLMLFMHGWAKIQGFAALSETFPDPIGWGSYTSLVLMILAESVCSLLVILGLFTRLAVLPIIFGMCVAAFVAHAPVTLSGSELPLLYLLIFLTLLLSGAGKFSADHVLNCRCKSKRNPEIEII